MSGTFSIISRSATRSAHATRALHASARASVTARYPQELLPVGVDPDSFVPPYYIERQRQREAIAERKDQEGGLMHELSAGILSDDVAATTRRAHNKIPTEHTLDGVLMHPSGFIVPTPGDAFEPYADIRERDMSVQTAAVAARVNELRQLRGLSTAPRAREEKVPYELVAADGTVCHASGFIPPTPAHGFASAPRVAMSEGVVTLRETSGPAARTPWKQG